MSALEQFDDEPVNDELLCDALTALIKQGIDFVSLTAKNGRTEYTINGIRFAAEDIRFLQQQGALNAQGIQRYLVSR
jgi:hypothetical protein